MRELTELANVSRGTFYFHYTDIYDLMDHVEREQIHTLELLMDDILPRLEEDSTPEALRALFSYLDENDGICSVLLGTNGDTAFVHRLKGVIEESCLGYLRPREKETQLQRYMVAFAVQGCFGNIDLWLQNGKPETVDEWQISHGRLCALCVRRLRRDKLRHKSGFAAPCVAGHEQKEIFIWDCLICSKEGCRTVLPGCAGSGCSWCFCQDGRYPGRGVCTGHSGPGLRY